jgi:Flp pilus assembly protein TadG
MRSKIDHRKRQPARGQSLIEFVLVLPALLILFLGLIEAALALRAQLVLTNANREAARYASHGAFTDEQVAQRALISFSEQLASTCPPATQRQPMIPHM